jgi:hypothetical protein
MHPPFGGASLELRQTVKAVTPFGGLAVFAQFLERVGWSQVVSAHMPVHYSSPNAIAPAQTLTAFMISVMAGAKRFAHGSFLRADRALQAIFGLSRFPGDDAVRYFFGRFDAAKIEQFWKPIWAWLLERVPARREGYTLDLDSTVFERFGHQEGAERGYNPGRRGGRSHHPLLAVLSEACFVLHGWLRPGTTNANSGVVSFLQEALALAKKAKIEIRTLRADCGFYGQELLEYLEGLGISYLIIARQTERLKREIQRIEHWTVRSDGSAVGEFQAAVGNWKIQRRFVVLRRPEKETNPAPTLFALSPKYVYRVLVTNRQCTPSEAWVEYDGRARIELRFRELKDDLHADGFCLRSFHGSESAFLAVLCLYNLMGEFQRASDPQDACRRPRTVREEVFVCGAVLGRSGSQTVLYFSLAWGGLEQRKPLFDNILQWPPQKTPLLNAA